MEARDWILTLSVIGNFASGAWAYFDQRAVKMAKKIEDLEHDISSLKATAEAAPTHNDLAKVYEAVNKTNNTVHELVGENRRQSETLHLIHSFLLTGGKQ